MFRWILPIIGMLTFSGSLLSGASSFNDRVNQNTQDISLTNERLNANIESVKDFKNDVKDNFKDSNARLDNMNDKLDRILQNQKR